MDFHLCRDQREGEWHWRITPKPESHPGLASDHVRNFQSYYENGQLVGLMIGWSDLDMSRISGALQNGELETARSLLIAADGTFAAVFCAGTRAFIVTDVSGSIPVFFGGNSQTMHIASKADTVAHAIGYAQTDIVSMADFLQNGAVCHPYTLFEGVRVAPPASVSEVSGDQLSPSLYWTPDEGGFRGTLTEGAKQLRETLQTALAKGLVDTSKVTVMFSGGEDARSLVPLLPKPKVYRLRLIADAANRECCLASKAARSLGFDADLITRDSDHYRKQFINKVRWVGAGHDVRHFHVFGSTAEIMHHADAVVGGLGSDKLFKSDYLSNVANKARESFLPERLLKPNPDKLMNVGTPDSMKWMRPEISRAVWQRRQHHHKLLLTFRPASAGSWHTLWPLGSHSQAHSQFLNNLRYGPRVVEPFLCAATYKLAAIMPDDWKVDRKVFALAVIPPLGRAGWVPTSSGRIPALNGRWGRIAQFTIKSWRVLYDEWQKKRHPRSFGGQGPWSSDHKRFEFNPGHFMKEGVLTELNRNLEKIVEPDPAVNGFWSQTGEAASERRVMALQVAMATKLHSLRAHSLSASP